MKKLTSRIAAIALLLCATTLTAAASPFEIGILAGMNVNKVSVSNFGDNFSSDNRHGFSGGITAKFVMPLFNFGVDLSALYQDRTMEINNEKFHYNYLAIPLHARYDIPMPGISNVIYPTLFTGPNFAIRLGSGYEKEYKANKYNVGWDFGLGLTFFKHLQISASYTLGISSKALSYVGIDNNNDLKGKTNGWAFTAAYYF